MAKYLVTGGAGFIGSHLVNHLIANKHQVQVLDNLSSGRIERLPDSCELIRGDVRNATDVARAIEGVEGCFHLAAIASVQKSNDDWSGTHQTNLVGTVNVLNAARRGNTPVVFASSAAVYGDNAEIPVREHSLARPITAYGADKLGSELHGRVAGLVHGVPSCGLRLFNVYGPEQDPTSPYSGVISKFVDQILKGETITTFGDGEQRRDFVYVADAVSALCAAMTKADTSCEIYNVCTGDYISVSQLARVIMSILGVQVPILHQPSREGDIRVSIGDPNKACRNLGFTARWTLVDGLRALIAYEEARLLAVNDLRVLAR